MCIRDRFEVALSEVDAVICPSGGMVFAVNAHAQQGDAEAMKEVVKHFQGQFTIQLILPARRRCRCPADSMINNSLT